MTRIRGRGKAILGDARRDVDQWIGCIAGALTRGDYTDSMVRLDARAPGWYEREHLPGAHRLARGDLPGSARGAVPDPTTPVAVYCWNTTCTGSEIAAAELEPLGYQAVHRYIGGNRTGPSAAKSAAGRPAAARRTTDGRRLAIHLAVGAGALKHRAWERLGAQDHCDST